MSYSKNFFLAKFFDLQPSFLIPPFFETPCIASHSQVIQEALSWAVVNLDPQSMRTILEVAELQDEEMVARLKSDDELMITLTVENCQDGARELFRYSIKYKIFI